MGNITPTDFNAIVTGFCAILTTILIPCIAYIVKEMKKNKKRADTVDQMPNKLEEIHNDISVIKESQQDSKKAQTNMEEKFDKLETQQLKYIINDAFFSCNGCLEDLSYESLINAYECAQIYIGKGLNHETGARCEMLFKEVERRATLREEDDK